MKFAYADPPYLGCGKKHYKEHPEAGDWDDPLRHVRLLEDVTLGYPDGWAMSCHTPSLGLLLRYAEDICEPLRVCAWVKPFASFKPGVNPGYCWEPVLLYGGRKREKMEPTIRDFHSANITMQKGTHGAKPDSFNEWILDLLNVQPGDTLDDLFPGSGGMARALAKRGI